MYQCTLNNLRERLSYSEHILRENGANGANSKDNDTKESSSKDSEKLLDLKNYIQQNGLSGYDSNINTVKGKYLLIFLFSINMMISLVF